MHFIWCIRYRMETHFHSWPPFSILYLLYHTVVDYIYWPMSLFIHLVFVLANTCNTHKYIGIFTPILTHINISYCIYSLCLSLLTWKCILEFLNDINSMQIISSFCFFYSSAVLNCLCISLIVLTGEQLGCSNIVLLQMIQK